MEQLEVRSFRSVFDLERRIYRIDTVRLNPAGVPVRGLLYAAALECAFAALARIPPAAWLLAPLPWYVVFAALPAALASVLTLVRIEGRPFHQAVRALLLHRVGPRHLSALAAAHGPGRRWDPPAILLIPDGSDARLRRLRFTGPGAVLIACSHERAEIPRRRGVLIRVRGLRQPQLLRRAVLVDLEAGSALQSLPFR